MVSIVRGGIHSVASGGDDRDEGNLAECYVETVENGLGEQGSWQAINRSNGVRG